MAKILKPYRVKLYDYFDHEWIDIGEEHHFSDKPSALADRNKLNAEKIDPNSLDHYGVIEITSDDGNAELGHEIDCPWSH